jgi:nitrogen fixation-related uncharacterized protein
MKRIALALAAVGVALGGFFWAAINTLVDDDYWPDWE